jgi:hypothetical protein
MSDVGRFTDERLSSLRFPDPIRCDPIFPQWLQTPPVKSISREFRMPPIPTNCLTMNGTIAGINAPSQNNLSA